MSVVPYESPVWDCGVCGNKGPWLLTLWWLDASCRYEVPGGVTAWEPEQPRMARGCSMECGKRFAKAAGKWRISITRPATDARHVDKSISWLKSQKSPTNKRRAA